MASGSKKAVVAALVANSGIAVAKFVGFTITGSGSMLAESAHSVADAGNQGLLLLGHARAKKAETPTHPFGHGRELYFWPFVVAIVLFTLGAGFSAREGIQKLLHPHEIESPAVALGILAAAILMEIYSFRVAIKEANRIRRGMGWWSFIRTNKSADLNTVLLEDLAALLGLVFAFIGVSLAAITDNSMWDAIGTLFIAVLLAVIAILLGIETKSLLIGEAASEEELAYIRKSIESTDGIERLISMRTEHRGPADILVAAKAAFRPSMTASEIANAINEAERKIRLEVPEAHYLLIEVDVLRGEPAPPPPA